MQETYKEFIQNILDTRGRFACGDEYHERHHILPKCLGGGNNEENLIDLYAREHFIAHKLLAQENPKNKQLTYAWWCISIQTNKHTKERYKITAEEYEEVKTAHVENLRKSMSGSNNPMFGKNPYANKTEEELMVLKQRWSEKSSGTNNGMYGRKHTEESRKIMSEAHKGKQIGENNPFFGKQHTEETKELLRKINTGKKASQETRELLSKMRIGKNNPKAHPLYCYELNECFWGSEDVKRKYPNIPITNVILACRDSNRTCGKHPVTNKPLHWKSITMEEYDNYVQKNKTKGD